MRESLAKEFPADGIDDSIYDPDLDGIAPEGYYRATFQSREYMSREFGAEFDILEVVEQGALNLQDLVVMRKR